MRERVYETYLTLISVEVAFDGTDGDSTNLSIMEGFVPSTCITTKFNSLVATRQICTDWGQQCISNPPLLIVTADGVSSDYGNEGPIS